LGNKFFWKSTIPGQKNPKKSFLKRPRRSQSQAGKNKPSFFLGINLGRGLKL